MNLIYLVRHGENLANITKEFSYKKVDYSLTDKGISQAKKLAKYLGKMDFDNIYSSPLKRAIETAKIIASIQNKNFEIVEEFREINIGDLEGRKDIIGAWKIHDRIVDEWFNGNCELHMPNGENQKELSNRFISGIRYILSKNDVSKNIVVIGHGMNFFQGTMELCKINNQRVYYEMDNQNCSITTIEVTNHGSEMNARLKEWASIKYLNE